jgi:hypothetical protein
VKVNFKIAVDNATDDELIFCLQRALETHSLSFDSDGDDGHQEQKIEPEDSER